VRPGTPIVSVVDRSTVRMTFDVPESDFDVAPAGTPVSIQIVATEKTIVGSVARRSPSADPETRTVHVEVDLVDPERAIPVNTTGEVRIEVGQPIQATKVPLVAASITGTKATVFRIEGDVAKKVTFPIQGDQGSDVFVDTALEPGALVVTEGRATLADGDRVAPKEVPYGTELTQRPPEPKPPGVTP
jgi:hypothetical protein